MIRPRIPTADRQGQRQWSRRDVEQLAEWCSKQLATLTAVMPQVLERITDWTPSPIPSSDGPSVSGGRYGPDGAKNGSVPALVISNEGKVPEVVSRTRTVLLAVEQITLQLDMMTRALTWLSVVDADTESVFRIQPPAGQGSCANPHCGRWVPGGRDRLRGGRCGTCAEYKRRTGSDRSASLCNPTTEVRAT